MEGEQRPAGSLMVALLGPVRIGLAGQEMAPVAQQLLRVLTAMLGLAAGRAVSVPALIDGLWGEDATPERAKNLHSRISALQRLLEEAEPGRGGSRVVRSGDGYLLRLDPGCLDVQEFTALAERARGMARSGDIAGAAGLFPEALALWRGPAVEDAAPWCPWLAGEAARLEEARAAVAEERVECDLALGRHGDTVTEIASLAGAFPLRERLTGQLMVALWRCGRRGDALAAYDRTRRVLATELGLDPGPELRLLHTQLLADDPSLAAPAAGTGTFPAAGPARGAMPAPVASFVGRQSELTELGKLVGRHRLVTITGPGGAGKTRLAIEVTAPLAANYRDGAWFAKRGLDTATDVSPELRCAALNLAGQAELRYDTESSRAYFTEALGIARRIGDDKSTATALWGLSFVHRYAGDAEKQAACASEAVAIARSSGDAVLLGECLLASSEYLRFNSRPSLTRAVYDELPEVTSQSGDRIYEALAHNNFGDWALIAGDLETARDHLEQAQAIYAEIGKLEPVLASNLGWVSFGYGNLTAAQANFARAVQMAELHRVRRHASLAILGLGCVAAARQDWERAAKPFGFADAEQANCGAVWLPPEKTYREQWAGETEHALGPQRFASLHGSGQGTDRDSLVDFTLGRSTSPLGSSENPGLSPLMLPASNLHSPVGDQSPHAHCPSRRQAQHLCRHARQLLRDRRHLPARQPDSHRAEQRNQQPRQYPLPNPQPPRSPAGRRAIIYRHIRIAGRAAASW